MRKLPLFVLSSLLVVGFASSLRAQSADLSITKTGPSTATAGSTVTYNITVRNNGPNAVTNASWNDTLPPFTTFVSFTQSSGPLPTNCSTGGTINCTISFGAPGSGNDVATYVLIVRLDVTAQQGSTLTNTATVFGGIPADPNPANNSSSTTATVVGSADVGVTKSKTAPSGNPATGQNVTYSIAVTNAGPTNALGVVLTDPLPANTTFVSLTQTNPPMFTCGTPAAGTSGTVTCTLQTLQPTTFGPPPTFTLVVRVNSNTPNGSPLTNTATVSSSTPDPDNTNNSATVSSTVTAQGNISLSKFAAVNTTAAGTNITYSIDVSNNMLGGPNPTPPADVQNLVLTDTPSANTTFVSITQNSGPTFNCTTPAVGANGAVNCTIATFPSLGAANFTLVLRARPDANHTSPGSVRNTVSTTSTTPGGTASSTPPDINVGTSSDVGVTKTGPANTPVGGTIGYNIVVSNAGPSDAFPSLTDTIPTGTTFVSFSQNTGPAFTCTTPALGATGNVNCSLAAAASFAPGLTASFTLTVRLDNTVLAGASVTNTATVDTSPSGRDPNPSNNSASVITTVTGSADLSVTKTGPAVVTPGMTTTYNVTVTNGGPSGAQTVTLTDSVPSGMTFASITQTAGPTFSCTTPAAGGTGAISCTIPTFASASTATFSIVMNVLSSQANGSMITNTASVTSSTPDPTPGNNSSTSTSTAARSADLAVTKTGPATLTPGNNITYTVTVGNTGPSDAQTVALTDTIPTGSTFVSEAQTSGPAFTCTNPAVGAGGTITCNIASLAVGASAAFNITIRSSSAMANGATLSNTANVTSATTDPNPSNNSSTSAATATATADLAITKTGPAAVAAGGTLTYNLVVTNNGPSDAQSVVMTDAVPASATFVSETQTSGPVFACTNPAAGATGTVSCSIGTLATGASAAFTIVMRSNSGAASGSTITNTASVSSASADSNTANNSASVGTLVSTTVADVAVTKTGSPPNVTPGSNITYTVIVTNNGPADAQTVLLTDAIPANTTFVSESQTSGPAFTCSTPPGGGTGTISCNIASLANGASATFSIVVQVNGGASAGTITNTANVSAATGDPSNANNSATATTTVGVNQADLSVTKSGTTAVTAGTDITYTITVTNNGPGDAQNVSLTDVIPANTTFASESQTSGVTFTCTTPSAGASGTVACTTLSLINGSSAAFRLVVHTASTATGTITNPANVTSATPDPNGSNNSSSANTAITTVQADVSVTKSGSPSSVAAGANITYTITVMNNGPADAQNVLLSDAVPANTTLVSESQTSGPTFTCSTPSAGATGTISCTIATLANAASAVFSVVVHTATTATGTITNTATVTAATADSNAANNSATATTTITGGGGGPTTADLSVIKSAAPPITNPGGTVVYTIAVANAGPAAATAVAVSDTIPAGATFVSATASQGSCTGTATVTCSLGTLNSGATATITLTVTAPTTFGVFTNSASVTSATTDPNPANNTGSAPAVVASDIPALSPMTLALMGLALAAVGFVIMKQ